MKKTTISILGKTYNVSLEDDFSEFLKQNLKQDFGGSGISDMKLLLNAYIKKCYKIYEQTGELRYIEENIDFLKTN